MAFDNFNILQQLQETIIEYQDFKSVIDKYQCDFTRIPLNIHRVKCVLTGSSIKWFFNDNSCDFGDVSWTIFNNEKLNFPSNVYNDEYGNVIIEWDNLMLASRREEMMQEIGKIKQNMIKSRAAKNMDFYDLMDTANKIYQSVGKCPEKQFDVDCYNCISANFYTNSGTEKYDCEKGLAFYILNYGPCYASSTYHFLNVSQLLNANTDVNSLNILSIGCGFAPDYYAFKRFITDNQLTIQINYTGIELHREWDLFHQAINANDKHIIYQNVLADRIVNIETFDIIILDKFFSTLANDGDRDKWLKILQHYIKKDFKQNAILIFKDINEQSRGRDVFDNKIKPLFQNSEHYKFNIQNAYGWQYKNIDICNNIFTNIRVECFGV